MANKLSRILPQYRNYQADQVLTHTQLNETIAYFEDQDRLSRIGLTGVGIINGLQLTTSLEGGIRKVVIHQGYGITTDGDLLTLQQPVEELGSKEKTIQIESLEFSHYRPFEDDKATYAPFAYGTDDSISVFELCQSTDDGALPLSGMPAIAKQVFLLYLECYPKDQDICGDINCDNQGIEQVARLRFLMIQEDNMIRVCASDSIYHRFQELKHALSSLTTIRLLHVVLNDFNSQTPLQVDRLYREAIVQGNTVQEFVTAVRKILDGTRYLWVKDRDISELSADLNMLVSQHLTFPAGSEFRFNQYRYALLKDLADEFNLLVKEISTFRSLENPDINAFPKHLLLGRLGGENYRHDFYASPAVSNYHEEVSSLLRRLRKIRHMLLTFDLTQSAGIRIIPSGFSEDAGIRRSIPFYYRPTQELIANWSGQPGIELISYHYGLGDNPLLIDHTNQTHFLIGGHLRTNAENTFQSLNIMIRQFGLDVVAYRFDFGLQVSDFRKFMRDHPGCAHMSGVPRSGTYILLSNNNEVIGDLALHYRVVNAQTSDAVSHIKVAETRYPWISSLSYLNNLSRSLRGTPKRGVARITNYRLIVSDYSINGQQLTAGPTEVLISLEDILLRRMHAITDALNKRFPNGLVFDYNEQLKRFVIIRAFDDEFKITFTDNTMTVNKPAFSYSQHGMFRADRVFRLDAIRSEERRRYRETTYRQLQGEFAPVGKDDDYGKYQGKWADWYRLIEILNSSGNPLVTPRFIQRENQLPASVSRIIREVYNHLVATGRGFELYLTGDWLDGSWVSIEMLNQFGNSNNTVDPIVRFLHLRETLHRKTQATKASLFLVLARESDRTILSQLIAGYTSRVDIYIDGPRIGRRLLLIDGMNKIKITGK
jgi:hypothetical protein